jgi:hypothetical protein
MIAKNAGIELQKLSHENCDEIFGVVDVKKNLYYHKQVMNPYTTGEQSYTAYEKGFTEGFNKAMELNATKQFTRDDVISAIVHHTYLLHNDGKGYEDGDDNDDRIDYVIAALKKQPTEIEVEIDMECLDPNCDGIDKKGVCIPGDKPKLDSEGCLILKKYYNGSL